MSKNTEAIISFIIQQSYRPILTQLNSKFRTNQKMLFPSVVGNVSFTALQTSG